jgi:predicted ABC-type transport system involved in lysophospholipase L1 biosynthesis ATPase subunit
VVSETAEPKPLVELRAVSKHFGEGSTRVDALVDVTMSVVPGEVVGLLGPSGSGKTTLLNMIGCVIEPSKGWMSLDGEVVYDQRWLRRDLRRLRLEKIGFIFQIANLLPFLTSTENMMEVMELAGAASGHARTRTIDLLEYLDVGHRRSAMPAQLSGGEAQRVPERSPTSLRSSWPTSRPPRLTASAPASSCAPAQGRVRAAGRHTLRNPRRQDLRPLRPHLPPARWPTRVTTDNVGGRAKFG